MINPFTKNAHLAGARAWQLALVCSLILITTGCGKDEDDGDITNSVALPVDIILNLYCADIGIHEETCVLDDPGNPYARVGINNDNKFDLAAAAPSPKARFYLWATALARDSTGENQWNTANALYQLFDASGSDLIKDQSIRAYRSVLDNYFDSITFFEADFIPDPDILYPFPVRTLAANELRLGIGGTLFFDADPLRNDFLARVQLVEWGYLYDDVLDEVNPL